ncbi:MAG: hypothetical protein AB7G80_08900 [Dongiaceae bacterium]
MTKAADELLEDVCSRLLAFEAKERATLSPEELARKRAESQAASFVKLRAFVETVERQQTNPLVLLSQRNQRFIG